MFWSFIFYVMKSTYLDATWLIYFMGCSSDPAPHNSNFVPFRDLCQIDEGLRQAGDLFGSRHKVGLPGEPRPSAAWRHESSQLDHFRRPQCPRPQRIR